MTGNGGSSISGVVAGIQLSLSAVDKVELKKFAAFETRPLCCLGDRLTAVVSDIRTQPTTSAQRATAKQHTKT